MTTLVVILFISNIFGGTFKASLQFASPEKCAGFKHSLVKYTVKHTIVEDCKLAPQPSKR